jgi:hypothetical protein
LAYAKKRLLDLAKRYDRHPPTPLPLPSIDGQEHGDDKNYGNTG